MCEETEDFTVKVCVYQKSALNSYFFLLIIDELTKSDTDEPPQCIVFADDVVLVDGNTNVLDGKLEHW